MAYVKQSMKQGETLHYNLILANVYKRGIQKVEFTIQAGNTQGGQDRDRKVRHRECISICL